MQQKSGNRRCDVQRRFVCCVYACMCVSVFSAAIPSLLRGALVLMTILGEGVYLAQSTGGKKPGSSSVTGQKPASLADAGLRAMPPSTLSLVASIASACRSVTHSWLRSFCSSNACRPVTCRRSSTSRSICAFFVVDAIRRSISAVDIFWLRRWKPMALSRSLSAPRMSLSSLRRAFSSLISVTFS